MNRALLNQAVSRLEDARALVLAAARMGDANFHADPGSLHEFALRAAAEKMVAVRLGELCGAEIAKRIPGSDAGVRVLALRDEYERLRIELAAAPDWLAWAERQIEDEGAAAAAAGVRIGEAYRG